MGDDETKARWHALRTAREALIIHYAPLIHDVAGDVARKLQPSVDEHDLVGYGMFGLIDALETFVPGPHGTQFEAYATPRIEAAILHGLERTKP
jgi:RNA polymerase sigma factor for flagellar operon FliA